MAFLKCSSIYDVAIVFQRGFWIPDGTLKADHSTVSLKAKDIFYLVLFEIICIILGILTFNSDREMLESSSKLLDGGLNFAMKFSFFLSIFCRLAYFGMRFQFWKIVESLDNCDLLVNQFQNYDAKK